MQNAELLGLDGLPLGGFFLESWEMDESGLLSIYVAGGRMIRWIETGARSHGFSLDGQCGVIEFIRAEDDPEDIYSVTFVFDVLTRHETTCSDIRKEIVWEEIRLAKEAIARAEDPDERNKLIDRRNKLSAKYHRLEEESYTAETAEGGT